MTKSTVLVLAALCVAALAFALLRSEEREAPRLVDPGSATGASNTTPTLLPSSPDMRPGRVPVRPPGDSPVARSPGPIGTAPSVDDAASLAAAIRSTAPANVLEFRRLLARLAELRTQAACDALLALVRDRILLDGNEGEWAQALAAHAADERVSSTMREVLIAAQLQNDFSFSTDARLWAVAMPRDEEGRAALAERLLVQASPALASSVRSAILDALPKVEGEALRRAVQEALRENATSASAYRLLLRTGDEASIAAAYEGLRYESLQPGSARAQGLAPELGAVVTDTTLAGLRGAAVEGAAGAGLYLATVSGMAPERVKAESSAFIATLSRTLADVRGRTDLDALLLRKHAALAVERIASLIASPELADILEQEVRAGGSTARYASAALARVREALAR